MLTICDLISKLLQIQELNLTNILNSILNGAQAYLLVSINDIIKHWYACKITNTDAVLISFIALTNHYLWVKI